MRLAFFRSAQTSTTPMTGLSYSTGVPVSAGSTLRAHTEAFGLVGNSGNMIHRMAMIQLLEFDRNNSAQINLLRLISKLKSPSKVATFLAERYDGLVITMSNILRLKSAEPGMPELIRELNIPIYSFGAGMQDDLAKGDKSAIDPGTLDLMQALDEKAVIFGVRGEQTLEWLKSVGIRNAEALGCPSMFVYPRKIMSLQSPKTVQRVITAGHMALKKDDNGRIQKLARGMNGVYAAYVFQGETKNFTEILDEEGVYDESTQKIDTDVMERFIKSKIGENLPFSEYYSFNEVTAWRAVSSRFDAYVGDRIHGGVAAMQAGVPSLVLHNDARVRELAEFHGIPSCSLNEFSEMGALEAVRKFLSNDALTLFKKTYEVRLQAFNAALHKASLRRVS